MPRFYKNTKIWEENIMDNTQNAKVTVLIPEALTIDIVYQNDNPLGTFEVLKDELDILERSGQKKYQDDVNM